jgi:hypothetical protein
VCSSDLTALARELSIVIQESVPVTAQE